jgi:hypothetical protein
MFLLPAIGAWISDGLILYIYFSGGKQHQHATISLYNYGGGDTLGSMAIYDSLGCGRGHIDGCDMSKSSSAHSSDMEYFKRNDSTIGNLYELEIDEEITDLSASPSEESSSSFESKDESLEKIANNQLIDIPTTTIDGSDNDSTTNQDAQTLGSISSNTLNSTTRYLSILAIIRLLLLTFPLSYAAYSGTRVPCAIVQYIFHGMCFLIVLGHMLAVTTLDSTDDGKLSSGVNNEVDSKGEDNGNSIIDPTDGDETTFSRVMEDRSITADALKLLSLSLVSIMLHCLIVLHVRSTGPIQDGLYEEKRKRKRLAYAMVTRDNNFVTGSSGGMGESRIRNGSAEQTINGHHNHDHDEEDNIDDETRSPLLLPDRVNNFIGNKSLKERFMCLPEVFLNDTQARFDAAQRMWAERLEIMTHPLHQNSMDISGRSSEVHANSGRDDQLPTSPRNHESSNLIAHAINSVTSNATKLGKPDPFRVLLQLFAYEDVWSGTNNRLDLAFAPGPAHDDGTIMTGDVDFVAHEGSAALSFYAPQLLSFLLHGAYFDVSAKLEEWILKKCGQDLHFAHRCFWFLRSWCLGSASVSGRKTSQSHLRSPSIGSLGGTSVTDSLSLEPVGGLNKIQGIESNLYLSSSQVQFPAVPQLPLHGNDEAAVDPPGFSEWDNYSGADGYAGDSSSSKFLPDEQVLIEQLLRRVVDQGCRPATVAQYGSIDGRADDENDSSDALHSRLSCSPSALATALARGLIPIDPRTGFQSTAHLDCITSPHKYGFLPLSNVAGSHQQPITPIDATSLFFAAPLFLDALLSIADDLMHCSRPNRTAELRQRLRSLEVELLPSNVVYLPIRNMEHRVWRIVAEESLALSTNERVPCIITLEVIDYRVSANLQSVKISDDSTITSAWVSTPRNPKRHSTLIDKVANYTQEGLKRLEHTIDHLSHHGDGKSGNLDRRLSEFLGMHNKSHSLYVAVQSYDEDENNNGQDEEAPEWQDIDALTKKPNIQLCPKPLHGPEISGKTDDAPLTPTPTSSTFENDDVQQSPMGQWTTPKKKNLTQRKRNMEAIGDIAEEDEDESDEDFSPQAKQRRKVSFPPASSSMVRSSSVGDVPTILDPIDAEDTEQSILKSNAPTVVFKEDWVAKTERLRKCSIYGSHPGWRLLPILIKSNDDLRQEQLASQLIQRMATILAKARVPVWLFPYEIVALTGRGGSKLRIVFALLVVRRESRC